MAYRAPDGTMLPTVPEDLDLLEKCEVGGWSGWSGWVGGRVGGWVGAQEGGGACYLFEWWCPGGAGWLAGWLAGRLAGWLAGWAFSVCCSVVVSSNPPPTPHYNPRCRWCTRRCRGGSRTLARSAPGQSCQRTPASECKRCSGTKCTAACLPACLPAAAGMGWGGVLRGVRPRGGACAAVLLRLPGSQQVAPTLAHVPLDMFPRPHPSPLARTAALLPHRYVTWVEAKLGVHCKWIGVGPGRDAIVIKPNEL